MNEWISYFIINLYIICIYIFIYLSRFRLDGGMGPIPRNAMVSDASTVFFPRSETAGVFQEPPARPRPPPPRHLATFQSMQTPQPTRKWTIKRRNQPPLDVYSVQFQLTSLTQSRRNAVKWAGGPLPAVCWRWRRSAWDRSPNNDDAINHYDGPIWQHLHGISSYRRFHGDGQWSCFDGGGGRKLALRHRAPVSFIWPLQKANPSPCNAINHQLSVGFRLLGVFW